eukprot:CAMPEP_0113482780 /NCGR_PEP_ID=MMETSP0014_2-20120614/23097_1 /TAXON_ID=2857 /ORGANISM="Nitzschia sp." /LENGTH=373 /DNA_ID=CAMNT_0000376311 /DNA_START=181 /DNA_END=1302 /DNA_ORIENTATION=- /assembly_acc=CAM_ASM_000159
MMRFCHISGCLFLLLLGGVEMSTAFVPKPTPTSRSRSSPATKSTSSAVSLSTVPTTTTTTATDNNTSYFLSRDEVKPIIKIGKGDKQKIINGFGLWAMAVSFLTGPPWLLAMKIVQRFDNDTHRELFDLTGKIWAKTWLTLTNSYPTITGNLKRVEKGNSLGPCLYVANHASWLDIPVLCTVLDPVFKFIAKGELAKVPCIGTQLSGGEHIMIDRDDRKSQLRTFKETIGWLKKGVPIMAFPEGQRSYDGRLMDFKGGLFLAAVKTGVPIVPITISHAHAVMPSNSFFPVQSGRGKLHVHVHDQIDTTGKKEDELVEAVRSAFISTLPAEQHPIEKPPALEDSNDGGDDSKIVAETKPTVKVTEAKEEASVTA